MKTEDEDGTVWQEVESMLERLASQPDGDNSIKVEDSVVVVGLVEKAQYNGRRGVVSSFETHSQRFVVKLEDGNQLALKPVNLFDIEVLKNAADYHVQYVSSSEELNEHLLKKGKDESRHNLPAWMRSFVEVVRP